MICPDCKGSGKITLFTSVEPCQKCMGCGKVMDGDEIASMIRQWPTAALPQRGEIALPPARGSELRAGDVVGLNAEMQAVPLSVMDAIAKAPPLEEPTGRALVRRQGEVWFVVVPPNIWRYLFWDRSTNKFNVGGFSGEEVGLITSVIPAPSEQVQRIADEIRNAGCECSGPGGTATVTFSGVSEISLGRVSVMDDGQSVSRLWYIPLELAKEAVKKDAPVLYCEATDYPILPLSPSAFNLEGRGKRLGAIRMIWLDDGPARSPELRTPEQRSEQAQRVADQIRGYSDVTLPKTRGQQVADEAVTLIPGRHRVDGCACLAIEGTSAGFVMPINPNLSEKGVEMIRKHLAELIDRERADAVTEFNNRLSAIRPGPIAMAPTGPDVCPTCSRPF